MEKTAKIYIAGHSGMVGSAIMRKLAAENYSNLIFRDLNDLDLTNQEQTNNFFRKEKPEYVIIAAAKVGGIHANNTYRAEFIYTNLMIECNLIHAAFQHKVNKLLFLGSSCIYPKHAPQPISEEHLLSGYLEPTNEPYAIAKIAGIKLCENYRAQYGCNFISAMPTNLYGQNDNYDLKNSHVIPALIRKFHEAKISNSPCVEIWGTGTPKREFLYVNDLAEACLFLMHNYNDSTPINVGSGQDITISDLAKIIKNIVDYKGDIIYKKEMPDGTPQKLLDVAKINKLGWRSKISLEEGILKTYQAFQKSISGEKN